MTIHPFPFTRALAPPALGRPTSRAACRLAAGTAVVALLAGCAGYSITYRGTGPGYDVYRPEPYLVVSQAAAGGVDAKVIWLPNYAHPYRVHSRSGWGKSDFKFIYADGWQLASVEDKVENAEFANQILDIVRSAVPGLEMRSAIPSTERPGVSAPFGVYRFEFDSTRGAVTGLRKLEPLVGR